MLFLSGFVAEGDDKRFNDEAKSASFFVTAGCGHLGLSILCGIWVRAESWIVVGCVSLVSVFLATLSLWLEREADIDEATTIQESPDQAL